MTWEQAEPLAKDTTDCESFRTLQDSNNPHCASLSVSFLLLLYLEVSFLRDGCPRDEMPQAHAFIPIPFMFTTPRSVLSLSREVDTGGLKAEIRLLQAIPPH